MSAFHAAGWLSPKLQNFPRYSSVEFEFVKFRNQIGMTHRNQNVSDHGSFRLNIRRNVRYPKGLCSRLSPMRAARNLHLGNDFLLCIAPNIKIVTAVFDISKLGPRAQHQIVGSLFGAGFGLFFCFHFLSPFVNSLVRFLIATNDSCHRLS